MQNIFKSCFHTFVTLQDLFQGCWLWNRKGKTLPLKENVETIATKVNRFKNCQWIFILEVFITHLFKIIY